MIARCVKCKYNGLCPDAYALKTSYCPDFLYDEYTDQSYDEDNDVDDDEDEFEWM